jgi:hypothetical protein
MGLSNKVQKDTQDTSTATCPHCNAVLGPIPKRKTKCRDCGKEIYVRADPFDKQKTYYLKHEDALSLDMARDLQVSEKAFTEAKNKAPKGRSLGDIVWELIGQQKQEAARKNDWQTVSRTTWRQARHLYEAGREYFHVQQAAMKEQLQGALAQGVTHVKILSSRDDRTCEKCRSQDGMIFTIEEAIEKMPLPVKCNTEEGWCRCVYTYHRMK